MNSRNFIILALFALYHEDLFLNLFQCYFLTCELITQCFQTKLLSHPLLLYPSQIVLLLSNRFSQFAFQVGDEFDLARLPTAKAS